MTSDFKNLRSQCVFKLAELVNNHKIASSLDGEDKERIIEELSVYQDASMGDGKRMPTKKEDIKEVIGRSPDDSDCWVIRMFFVIRDKVIPYKSEEYEKVIELQNIKFDRNFYNKEKNSSK